MAVVKVKEKYQVTIPAEIRKRLALKVGDYLEVETRGPTIVLTAKAMIDKEKKEAWERLGKLLDRVHHKIGDVPEDEVERDVLEAIRAVREQGETVEGRP